jgi:hypothetical protein
MRRLNGKLMLVGLLALVLSPFSRAAAQDEASERFQRSFPLASGSWVTVENYKGTIEVQGSNQEQVTVAVYKHFEGTSRLRSQWLEETKVDFSTSGNRLRVKVEYPKHYHGTSNYTGDHDCDGGDFAGSVELTIRTPRQVNLDLDGYKPDMMISSIQGDLRIESYKSPITIESTVGSIRVHTYKETIKMRNVDIEGALYVDMYKGELDIDASDLGESATLKNYKAEVVLRLPAHTPMTLDMDGAKRGSFESDFPVMLTGKVNDDEIRGTINGGGPRLRLSTYSGSLSLRRK